MFLHLDSGSDTIVSGGNLSPLGALSSLETTPHVSRDNSPNQSPSHSVPGLSHPTPLAPARSLSSLTSPNSPVSLHSLNSAEEAVDALTSSLAALSPASSCGTIMTCDGHVYKNARDDMEKAMFMLYKAR